MKTYHYLFISAVLLVALTSVSLSGNVVVSHDDFTITIKNGRSPSAQTSCGAGWQRVSHQQRTSLLAGHPELQCTGLLPEVGGYCCQTPRFNNR